MRKGERKVYIPKGVLEEEYLRRGKTYEQIANEYACSKHSVISQAREYGIKSRSAGQRRIELKGKQYNSLTVLEDVHHDEYVKWLCRCECGNIVILTGSVIATSNQKGCWSCRNKRIGDKNWRGCGEISGEFWSRAKRAARVRNLPFEITNQEGWNLFLKQARKCALSGVELVFMRHRKDRAKTTASLDRIDSTKGYIQGNIQWVHKDINRIKMNMDNNRFIELCKMVATHHVNK